jgi:hypothetical protein
MADLFSLFDGRFKSPGDVVATPPQSLESLSEDTTEQEMLLRRIRQFEEVRPKVDYSDFSNFVFFNSALDYFNITGEKILNEYPYDGAADLLQAYEDDLDEYQRHVLTVWPSRIGHLRFDPAVSSSYVAIEDLGTESGTQRTGLLSVGTGSWTVEAWVVPPPALTGSNDVMVLVQKTGSAGDGYTAFFSGSKVHFRVSSASLTDEVSSPVVPGQVSYLAFSLDRTSSTSSLSVMTGSTTQFPVAVMSASVTVSGTLYMGPGQAFVGSGSLASKTVRPLTGSVDDVRMWRVARSVADVSSSFNVRVRAQDDLVGLWRFNESGSVPNAPARNAIVLDSSGRRVNGRIVGYHAGMRASGSLLPYDSPDPILEYDAAEIQAFIYEQQTSGTLYDRTNDNLITRLFPSKFFEMEEFRGTTVLQDFLYVLARMFDDLKVRIDQFVHVMRTNYTNFNQAPDALLAEVARFFGWEFTGNFLNADAFQYILGKNVLRNLEANRELETKLYEIKNEFWRRTLNNLMHLYKTKGTRESVESLLRVYGVNRGFVRLKEYGYKPYGGLGTHRISAEKSVYALGFGSGSLTASVSSSFLSASLLAIEARVKFPLTSSADIQASHLTGSIWYVLSSSANGGVVVNRLSYQKESLSSLSGALILSGPNFYVSMSAPVFDSEWYNVAAVLNDASGTVSLSARRIDDGEVVRTHSASVAATVDALRYSHRLVLGASGSLGAQYWMQEVRLWERPLEERELRDHALNFQSYGVYDPLAHSSKLALHWRMNENTTGSNVTVVDVSTRGNDGQRYNFASPTNAYKKFLNEYNFIASPEHGWNEDKIRVLESPVVKPGDAFSENKLVALEFNMIDALNEDISQMISHMDVMNDMIGQSANRYRPTYDQLDAMRHEYFKRLTGRLNFKAFADMLEFFDRSFVGMVRRLIPASVTFLGDEFVVESHMLERPKVRWNYRRQERVLELEGRIQVFLRD